MDQPHPAKTKRRIWRPQLLAAVAYLVLAILFTWPLVRRFFDVVPGIPGDVNVFVWNLWWIRHAIVELHTNPYYTDFIFHPQGVGLFFHTLTLFNGLVAILLQWFFGLVGAFNVLVLLSFVFSGMGAYFLAHQITRNRLAAFVAGLVFAFCPYRFAHLLGHHNLMATQWIPFYILFLIRMRKSPPQTKWKNGVAAGIFLLLTGFSSYYYVIYLMLFTAGWVVHQLAAIGWSRTVRATAGGFQGIILVGALLFLPMALLLFGHPAILEMDSLKGTRGSDVFVADALGFVTPSEMHPVFGGIAGRVSENFTGNTAEKTVFFGYAAILLGALALRQWRRHPAVRGWAVAFLCFAVLSLGSRLHVLGRELPLPLPGALLNHVPVLNNLRAPSRFSIMAVLSLAMLAAIALSHILRRQKRRTGALLATSLLAVVILFEYLPIPYPVTDLRRPKVYELIAADPEPGVVLEIPLGWSDGLKATLGGENPEAMYYQTIHGKKMFGGTVSRFPMSRLAAYEGAPVIHDIARFYWTNGESQLVPSRKLGRRFLKKYNVQYVVIHRSRNSEKIRAYLVQTLPLEKLHEDAEMIAYRVRRDGG